ncbi:hypothetical protein OROGR_031529 [Orobanche gracilis]
MNELLAFLLPSNEAKMSATADHHRYLSGNSSALVQAKGIQANSSGQFPSFLKQLLKSHLSGKFYLGLPKKFCDAHMPSHDDTIVLVDENDKEYNTKYSVRKNRLSGGWRVFSVAHELLEGDALVFHLIEPSKFRVYIMRAGRLTENDGSGGVQIYDFSNVKPVSAVTLRLRQKSCFENGQKSCFLTLSLNKPQNLFWPVKIEDQVDEIALINRTARQTYLNSLEVDLHRETKKARLISNIKLDNDMEHFGRNVMEGNIFSESVLYFKDVKSFEDFKIQVDGLTLDSDIPMNLRTKYYSLCCSQEMFLHHCLIKGLSSKLAIAIISETINIADGISSADLATTLSQFECWEKTLKAFEDLGMAAGFLRDRLQKLVGLKREFQATIDACRSKQAQADGQIRSLEMSSLNVRTLVGCLEAEVKALKWKNKKVGFEFEVLAQAPW